MAVSRCLPHALWVASIVALNLPAAGWSQTAAAASKDHSDTDTVEVVVEPGERQTFAGLGASLVRDDRSTPALAERLTVAQRTSMPRLLWHDARFHILRLWFRPSDFAPKLGEHDLTDFLNKYIRNHRIEDALAAGVDTLLLGPEEIPDYLGDGHGFIRDDALPVYAALLADFIAQVRRNCGVTFQATGLLNEPNDRPIRFHDAQWPTVVKALRVALDARELSAVKIVAPESANCGDDAYRAVDSIKADPAAWASLAGIATHSYNNAATPEMATRADGKEYWMTEAGGMTDTEESAGDDLQAASISSRLLNDLNHCVTHFIYFIGYELSDPKGNSDRIIRYETNPFRSQIQLKYDYLKALAFTFDRGAVVRHVLASPGGEMTYTYGRKPALNAAAARNPDGTWAVGLSNFTSDVFSKLETEPWYREQGGASARSLSVTIHVVGWDTPEPVVWHVHRCSAAPAAPDVTEIMHAGRLTLKVGPLELVTLRTEKH